MNKKLFLILLSLLTSFSVYAVRFNERGEKMIKEFTYHSRDGLRNRFVYAYDDNGDLISLTVYGQRNTLEATYYKDGNEIKYKGNEHCLMNIKTNEKGKITLIESYPLDDENKTEYKSSFFIDYICDNGINRIDMLTYICYSYDKMKKEYVPNPTKHKFKVINNNGLLESDSNWEFEPDLNHPNDTNVSFCGIINPTTVISSRDIDYLKLTEWMDIKSPYFAYYRPSYYYFTSYSYDDEGNIIQIRKVRDHQHLEAEVNIKYVE